jgi:hypothetical protein
MGMAQTEAAGQVRRFPVPRKAAAPVRALDHVTGRL